MLLKTHRNQLFSALQDGGVEPSLFTESMSTHKYELRSTQLDKLGFFFEIEDNNEVFPYRVTARPGAYGQARYSNTFTDWQYVFTHFKQWVKVVQEELETPNLWADLQANARLLGPTREAPEEVFTPDEARQLRIQLQHVQQRLLTAGLPEAAAQQLAATVQEAGAKAERFTKKEWQQMFLGSIIGAITTQALTPDAAKVVYQILKAAFSGLFLP